MPAIPDGALDTKAGDRLHPVSRNEDWRFV